MRAIFATALLAIGAFADNSKTVDFGEVVITDLANPGNFGAVSIDYNWVKSGG